MTVFRVETYVIKPEKQEEYLAIMKKWVAYIKKNKEDCKELKSWRLFSQMIGGNSGGYVEMGEFESLADFEKFMNRTFDGQNNCVRVYDLCGAWHILGEHMEFCHVNHHKAPPVNIQPFFESPKS